MIPNKVLLSGLAVAIIFSLVSVILPAIGADGLGLDLSWLADGDITFAELVAFLGSILVAISKPVRDQILSVMGKAPEA